MCFGNPISANSAEDVTKGIDQALSLENKNAFLDGLSGRLTELGIRCNCDETDIMLEEMKKRYKQLLGKSCPRTVIDWIKGVTPPGVTNRANNYDVCYALELDIRQTADFFQKHFLTIPFNSKNKTDAVYLYCIYNNKPYSTVTRLLDIANNIKPQQEAHTSTSQILQNIIEIDSDDEFAQYLSKHFYSPEQQYLHAKEIIIADICAVKDIILNDDSIEKVTNDRLNSLTVSELLGYRSQAGKEDKPHRKLPKRFTESLPCDVTIGQILKGGKVSYEVLRKTMMLLKFYLFYHEAENADNDTVCGNLLDFMAELNVTLEGCGFAQIYVRHPFDCLLMYCANSYDPIQTMYYINDSEA